MKQINPDFRKDVRYLLHLYNKRKNKQGIRIVHVSNEVSQE